MGIRQRLQAIYEDKNQFSFFKHVKERRDDDEELRMIRETHPFHVLEEEVIGRNDDKEAVIDFLLNSNTREDIAIASIVGMGGSGKTTLAQSIYNHERTTQFYLKLWVCVLEEFNLQIIIKKIIESATGKKAESSLQIDLLQCELKNKIEGKKYLLVMDDVWNENKDEWLHLKRVLMNGAKGSRILITTRNVQVAKTFDSTYIHSLQILDASNSWLLFQQITRLEERRSDNQEELDQKNLNLIQIGKEIVSRLKGVPLVIRTIGSLLGYNKSENFWISFMKNIELPDLLGQELLSILKLSFKYLPTILKQCILYYCTLFPKDFHIEKDVLIRLWRAQGFIQSNSNENFIDIGEKYFLELLSRSFFQEIPTNDLGDMI